jgi:hypothetical protein
LYMFEKNFTHTASTAGASLWATGGTEFAFVCAGRSPTVDNHFALHRTAFSIYLCLEALETGARCGNKLFGEKRRSHGWSHGAHLKGDDGHHALFPDAEHLRQCAGPEPAGPGPPPPPVNQLLRRNNNHFSIPRQPPRLPVPPVDQCIKIQHILRYNIYQCYIPASSPPSPARRLLH